MSMSKLETILRRTAAKTVNVRIDQVAELIGEEKADELCLYPVSASEIKHQNQSHRSQLKAEHKINTRNLGGYDRRQLINALTEARNGSEEIEGTKFNEAPDKNLLPQSKKKELEDRNLV